MAERMAIIGPPGAGKTTAVKRQLEAYAARHGAERTAVASMTRTAIAEIIGRDIPVPREQAKTMHGLAYNALGGGMALANGRDAILDWNAFCAEREAGSLELPVPRDRRAATDPDDVGDDDDDDDKIRSSWLTAINLHRAHMTDSRLWDPSLRYAYALWREWKAANALIDYTDMLEMAIAETRQPPGGPSALFVDEAQDLDPLMQRLIDVWAERMDYIVRVGDPDQCQPPGTLVRTTIGDVPIEDLDPSTHRLVSYDRHSSAVVGRHYGYPFEITHRPYSGELIEVCAGGHRSASTPDHRWPVRWQQDARWNVTYLMRQGGRWRVGWCQLFNAGSLHLGTRARLEQADEAWILGIYATKAEASAAESIIAATYGIPTICFRQVPGSYMQDQEWIDHVFNSIGDRRTAAWQLLRAHGRMRSLPFWSAADRYAKQGKRTPLVVHAANLIPEAMVVRTENEWVPFTARRRHYLGHVYSLSIKPHELYWSDGLLTHNCLYQWRGSVPNLIHEGNSAVRVLDQSYRVPRAVHAAAVRWIEQTPGRVPVEYRPTDEEGELIDDPACRSGYERDTIRPIYLAEMVEEYAAEGTVMVLASTHFPLGSVIAEFRRRGLPFHNPYRTRNGRWNPMGHTGGVSTAARLLSFAAMNSRALGAVGRPWTGADVARWAPVVRAEGVFVRGGKARLAGLPPDSDWPRVMRTLEEAVEPDALNDLLSGNPHWLAEHAVETYSGRLEYPIAVLEARGADALRTDPRVIIGTVHSVKGGEADTVILLPNLTPAEHDAWTGGDEGEAAVRRVFYVGMTRARHRLVLGGIAPRRYAVQWDA